MAVDRGRVRRMLDPERLRTGARRLADRRVRLAITGLSRSGKSVFITSLIQQLTHASVSTNLPFFRVAAEGRLLGVQPGVARSLDIPRFPYAEAIARLSADPPAWPEPTRGISAVDLALHFQPRGWLGRMTSSARLDVEIVDYPGEWLLDLPLMDTSFREWSEQVGRMCARPPRRELAGPWLAALSGTDLAGPADGAAIKALAGHYTEFLHGCREPEHGLSLIQPGRFVLPGELEGAPLLDFCPCPGAPADEALPPDCLFRTMERHFEAYKRHVVRPFYERYFARFDRQIVLADVLRPLNHGPASYADLQEAIQTVLGSFRYGRGGWLSRVFRPRIDRLLFAATKADQVTPDQWSHQRDFLHRVVARAENEIRCHDVQTETLSVAALRSTRSGRVEREGREIPCLVGLAEPDRRPVRVFPGEIPGQVPPDSEWTPERFHFIQFAPPEIPDIEGEPLPHVSMDRALEFVLGDKFG